MGKKDRQINPVQAQRKLEKKRLQKRSKEIGRQNHQNAVLQKENRRFEQELTELIQGKNSMAVVQAKLGQLNDIRIQLGLSTKSMSDLKFKTGKKQPGKDKKSVLLKEMESSDSDSSLIESDISEKDLAKETNFHNLSTIPIPNGEAPDTEGQIFRGLSQLKSVECSVFKSKSKITKSHHKPNHPPFNPMFLGFQNVPLPQPVMMYQPEYVAADDPPPEYSLPITSYSNAHKPDSKHSVTPVNRQPTIVAKPVVRDLQKELIQSNLIPSSVNRSKRASSNLPK
ncbi:hypothetical protein BC833DRAFT_266759 [Globomyces pollinis-pini]|nr:hypothetical protein BC833DRAFT_266759 [Globomyces pollinis-pini]